MNLNEFKVVSIIKRRIKDGHSYDNFRDQWLPEVVGQYQIPTYVVSALKVQDLQEVISIGLIASDINGIMKEAERTKDLDNKRKDKVVEVANSHGNAELYIIKDIDMLYSKNSNCLIKELAREDILLIVDAFQKSDWAKPYSLFEKYLEEQKAGERLVWLAFVENQIAGYVTLKWQSLYKPFADNDIPEIVDLNVLPQFRNSKVGSHLLSIAETEAVSRSDVVGIGVGLYGGKDGGYGVAQRLYVKRGYIPDGKGVTYNYEFVKPGDSHTVDDDLILWFMKKLK